MKILVTGFNALAIGTAKSPLNIATSARILPKVLEELGHDVTQKAIIPGEDVSIYDKVFVFVFGPNSLSARYWYGAAYTITKRPDAIISIDDWQTKDSVSGFGTFSRGHWRIWKKESKAGNPVGKVYWDEAQQYKKEIEDLVDTFAFEKWPHKLLVPAYDGGNYETLGMRANEIVNWDPTPYTDSYFQNNSGQQDLLANYSPVRVKDNAWVVASLVSKQGWLKNQKFNWKVKTYGNIKEGQERLKEHEMFQEYRKNWGVVSPPHYHTQLGSGWWRVRYKMAYDAGSIVYAHPEESKILYGKEFNISDIEKCSKEELKDIFNLQARNFKEKTWTRERTKDFFKCMLE